jgi:hypothetical protein
MSKNLHRKFAEECVERLEQRLNDYTSKEWRVEYMLLRWDLQFSAHLDNFHWLSENFHLENLDNKKNRLLMQIDMYAVSTASTWLRRPKKNES